MKRLILLLTISLLLVGCVTEKKARNWAYSHKDKLAEWCSDCYPVKPSDTIKGDTIIKVDSITSTDTIRVIVDCPDGTKVECPPQRTITRVIHSHSTDTIKVRDTAYERVIEDKNSKNEDKVKQLERQLEDVTESRNRYRKWFFILVGLLVAWGGIRAYFRR